MSIDISTFNIFVGVIIALQAWQLKKLIKMGEDIASMKRTIRHLVNHAGEAVAEDLFE